MPRSPKPPKSGPEKKQRLTIQPVGGPWFPKHPPKGEKGPKQPKPRQ